MDQIIEDTKKWIKDLLLLQPQIKPVPDQFVHLFVKPCSNCNGIGTIGVDLDYKYLIRCAILGYIGYKIYKSIGVLKMVSIVGLISIGLAMKDLYAKKLKEQTLSQAFLSNKDLMNQSWYYFKEVLKAIKLAMQYIFQTYFMRKKSCSKCLGFGYVQNLV